MKEAVRFRPYALWIENYSITWGFWFSQVRLWIMTDHFGLDPRKIIYFWTNLRISFDSHWVDPGLKHPDHLRANLFFKFFMLHKLCTIGDYWTEHGNNTILKSVWNHFRYRVRLYTGDDNEKTDDWPTSCIGEIQLECSWRNVWTRWRQSNGRKGCSTKNIETRRTSKSSPFLGKKI